MLYAALRRSSFSIVYIGLCLGILWFGSTRSDAQPLPTIEFKELWSIKGSSVPTEGMLMLRGSRFFDTRRRILFDTETGLRTRTFNGSLDAYPNDSTLVVSSGDTIHVVDVRTGFDKAFHVGATGFGYAFDSIGDTVILSSADSMFVVSLHHHDTISAAQFRYQDGTPALLYKYVKRIRGTDTIDVTCTADGSVHQAARYICPIRDLTQQHAATFGTTIGNRLSSSSGNIVNRHTGHVLYENASAMWMPNGDYVLHRHAGDKTQFVVLNGELDSLVAIEIQDSSRLPTLYWHTAPHILGIALGREVWELDTRALTIVHIGSTELTVNVLDLVYDDFDPILRSPFVVGKESAFWIYDLRRCSRQSAFTLDVSDFVELRPQSTANRIAFGTHVFDIDQAGRVVDSKEWLSRSLQYSYATDTWYSLRDNNEVLLTHTFDTTSTHYVMTHKQPVIDVWLREGWESYYTTDRTGLIIAWELATQQFRGVSRLPNSGVQLFALHRDSPGLIALVERQSNGRLVFEVRKDAGEHLRMPLGQDSVARLTDTVALGSITGPSTDSTYFIQLPNSDTVYAIASDGTLRSRPAHRFSDMYYSAKHRALVGCTGPVLYFLDPETLRINDSTMLPSSFDFTGNIRAGYDEDHILLQNPTVVGVFSLSADSLVRYEAKGEAGFVLGDGKTLVSTHRASFSKPSLIDLQTGDSLSPSRFRSWLPVDAMIDGLTFEAITADATLDGEAFVLLCNGLSNPVVCRTPSRVTIHYHDRHIESVSLVNNDEFLNMVMQVSQPPGFTLGSVFHHKESFAPLARTSPGDYSLFVTATDAKAIDLGRTTIHYRRTLGSIDSLGNMLQTGEAGKVFSAPNGSGNIELSNGIDRFGYSSYKGAFILNTSGVILDTVSSNRLSGSWQLHHAGRLMAIASNESVTLYDMHRLQVVGVSKQFASIVGVRWSKDGSKLFVLQSDDVLGLYDCSDGTVGVTEMESESAQCPFTTSIINNTIVITDTSMVFAKSGPLTVQIYTLSGELLGPTTTLSDNPAAIPIPDSAVQMMFVHITNQSTSCAYTLPIWCE